MSKTIDDIRKELGIKFFSADPEKGKTEFFAVVDPECLAILISDLQEQITSSEEVLWTHIKAARIDWDRLDKRIEELEEKIASQWVAFNLLLIEKEAHSKRIEELEQGGIATVLEDVAEEFTSRSPVVRGAHEKIELLTKRIEKLENPVMKAVDL